MTTSTLTEIRDFEIINPEGDFELPGSSDIFMVSDDGTLLIETPTGNTYNKSLPISQRTFRSHLITP